MFYLRNIFQLTALVLLSTFVLTSCASRGTGELSSEFPASLSELGEDPNSLKLGSQVQTLGPLDTVSVNVFGAPDLTGTYQIDYAGRLKIPLIDEVDAMGQTRLSLARILEDRLEESYLQNAEVTILVKNSRKNTFAVDGAVARPGRYPIEEATSLMEAVASSGGVDKYANLNRVVVFREIDGKRHIAGFSLREIRDGKMPDPEIRKDDIIIVDGSKINEGYREVLRSLPLLAFFRPF